MRLFERYVRSIDTVLIQNQILGISVFTIHKRSFKNSKIRILFNTSLILLFLSFTFYTAHLKLTQFAEAVAFQITEMLLLTGSCTYVTAVLLSAITNRNKMQDLFGKMVEFDEHLQKVMGISINYRKQRRRNLVHFCARYAVLVTILSYFLYQRETEMYTEIVRSILQVFKNATCYQFVCLIAMMKLRFQILNAVVRKQASKVGRSSVLCEICDLHVRLRSVVEDFNVAFGVILLILFGMSFVSVAPCMFYLINSLSGETIDWQFVASATLFCLSFAGEIFYLCGVCHTTIEEANSTSNLMLSIRTKEYSVGDCIKMFILQDIARGRVEFSAARLFPVDMTLIVGMVGGVATYSLILMQYNLQTSKAS